MPLSASSPIRRPWAKASGLQSPIESQWIVSAAEETSAGFIAVRSRRRPAIPQSSQVGQMAATAGSVSLPRQSLIGALLQGAVPRGTLRWSLWTNEALQRAKSMIMMVAALEHRVPFSERDWHRAAAEYRCAVELATAQRSLDVDDAERMLPCSEVLHTSIRCLITLFGPTVGQVAAHLDIEELVLPAWTRKVVVLAACRLVNQALVDGFPGRGAGNITVSLRLERPGHAHLLVSDDGMNHRQIEPSDIIFHLANALGSGVNYCDRKGGGSNVAIRFAAPNQTNA